MPDNTNNKRRFTIWRMAATVIAIGGMIIELITSTAFIGLIGVVIAMIILKRETTIWGWGIRRTDNGNP
uniref:Uncharacterized protein n=2 Tax=Candidatus Methanogaster sp. ANME-2c ERB4 TaxID=2759911 RepID=A0A7G9Y303_9EURY|nr:hypothetical protein LFOPHFOE_00027 [Methanosarcinales archaeon ANME-2c ERB4]